jgi:hypothetical protein
MKNFETCERNRFPLGYWPPGHLPTCQKCLKRVFHTWQAGWEYRQPGRVCECEQPALREIPQQMELAL